MLEFKIIQELKKRYCTIVYKEVAEEMKRVEELLHVSEENLTKAQKLARAQYYRRLSTKDRRKLKRLKKKNKK